MPICPIDIGRYGSDEIKKIFDEENRLQKMLDVEATLVEVLAELGEIPKEGVDKIREKANVKIVTIEKVKLKEKKTHHDIMAMVEVLAEECGDYGKYVHWGATSYDIVDTAWAVIIKDALEIIEKKLRELRDILCNLALKYKNLIMVGRTHGQHAIPITFGFKLAIYAAEIGRSLERLKEMKKRVLVGKMSGAVGTMASFGEKGMEIEKKVMEKLGIKPAEISTQIVCRDRLAELICWAAILASSLDRMATEIRNLQRTEILEVAEGFDIKAQVGSSTMPHKQNPVDCEKVSGLAKVLRGFVITALENIPLWHERDLTNSSSERFIIPHTFIILDEMITTMNHVFTNIRVFPERMKKNLEITKGAILTEAVMMALAKKGLGRQKAHELLRRISIKAINEGTTIKEELLKNEEIIKYLTKEEVENLMKFENYLGKTYELIDRAISYAVNQ
ncbi:MAG: adenylosuccinate lyase [Candidatus Methanomethylicaceae archaeon]|nr:adenylosuccinate lyase [Candidatus Verstraetearchaeota archaeon]